MDANPLLRRLSRALRSGVLGAVASLAGIFAAGSSLADTPITVNGNNGPWLPATNITMVSSSEAQIDWADLSKIIGLQVYTTTDLGSGTWSVTSVTGVDLLDGFSNVYPLSAASAIVSAVDSNGFFRLRGVYRPEGYSTCVCDGEGGNGNCGHDENAIVPIVTKGNDRFIMVYSNGTDTVVYIKIDEHGDSEVPPTFWDIKTTPPTQVYPNPDGDGGDKWTDIPPTSTGCNCGATCASNCKCLSKNGIIITQPDGTIVILRPKRPPEYADPDPFPIVKPGDVIVPTNKPPFVVCEPGGIFNPNIPAVVNTNFPATTIFVPSGTTFIDDLPEAYVIIPGPDGKTGTDDDVVIKPASIDDIDPETGIVTIPTSPEQGIVYTNNVPLVIPGVNESPATPGVFPEGTIVLPDGTIIVPGTGNYPNTPKINDDGTVTVGPGDIVIYPPYNSPYVVPAVPPTGGIYDPNIPGVILDGNPPIVIEFPYVALERIEVGTYPDMSYVVGDTLDLSDLTVTLYYNNGTSKEVPFAQFAQYGITVSPANGTQLTSTDTISISVTCDGITKPIGAITVAQLAVTGITVKTQPTTMTYQEGGAPLNLDGLVVTLTYNNGTTDNVSYAQFGVYAVTASPTNGTALTVAPHNGNPIVVKCNNFTANTTTLTVTAPAPVPVITYNAGNPITVQQGTSCNDTVANATVANATGTITYTAVSGLPAGLSIASDGTLSGTATTAGTYSSVVVSANFAGAVSVNATWTIIVTTATPSSAAFNLIAANGFLEVKRETVGSGLNTKVYSLIISMRNYGNNLPRTDVATALNTYFASADCPQFIKDTAIGVANAGMSNNGNSSRDINSSQKAFILSEAEAAAWNGRGNHQHWWLRGTTSNNYVQNSPANLANRNASNANTGMRPAFWIELDLTRAASAVPVSDAQISAAGFTKIRSFSLGSDGGAIHRALIIKTDNFTPTTVTQWQYGYVPDVLAEFVASDSYPQIIKDATLGMAGANGGDVLWGNNLNTAIGAVGNYNYPGEVFVLSRPEAEALGSSIIANNQNWWLRGVPDANEDYVRYDGTVLPQRWGNIHPGVRPAMWVAYTGN